jgi:hypothetical protein
MTTFAQNRDEVRRLTEIDERRRRAWGSYRDSLRDLHGREYEEAERRSWTRLQRKLAELEGQRAEVVGSQRRRSGEH